MRKTLIGVVSHPLTWFAVLILLALFGLRVLILLAPIIMAILSVVVGVVVVGWLYMFFRGSDMDEYEKIKDMKADEIKAYDELKKTKRNVTEKDWEEFKKSGDLADFLKSRGM